MKTCRQTSRNITVYHYLDKILQTWKFTKNELFFFPDFSLLITYSSGNLHAQCEHSHRLKRNLFCEAMISTVI